MKRLRVGMAVLSWPVAALLTLPSSRAAAQMGPTGPEEPAITIDLFPSQTWMPPPPPPPPAPPPPPPPKDPPPLPFGVRSLWLDPRGDVYVVLTMGAQEFRLCAACQKKGFLGVGGTLLGAYRIERVTRDEVQLTYLPMKRRQSISLGGGK